MLQVLGKKVDLLADKTLFKLLTQIVDILVKKSMSLDQYNY